MLSRIYIYKSEDDSFYDNIWDKTTTQAEGNEVIIGEATQFRQTQPTP